MPNPVKQIVRSLGAALRRARAQRELDEALRRRRAQRSARSQAARKGTTTYWQRAGERTRALFAERESQ